MSNIKTVVNNAIAEMMEKVIVAICNDDEAIECMIKMYKNIRGIKDVNDEYKFKDEADIIAYCINELVDFNLLPMEVEVNQLYNNVQSHMNNHNLNYKLKDSIRTFGKNLKKSNEYLKEVGIILESIFKYDREHKTMSTFIKINKTDNTKRSYTPKIDMKCEQCGKNIKVSASSTSTHHFCCKNCYTEWRHENNKVEELIKQLGYDGKEVACQYCGTILTDEQVYKHVYNHIKHPEAVKLQSVYHTRDCYLSDHHRKNYAKSYIDIPEEKK